MTIRDGVGAGAGKPMTTNNGMGASAGNRMTIKNGAPGGAAKKFGPWVPPDHFCQFHHLSYHF